MREYLPRVGKAIAVGLLSAVLSGCPVDKSGAPPATSPAAAGRPTAIVVYPVAARPAGPGRILFTSTPNNQIDLFSMAEDGSDVKSVTTLQQQDNLIQFSRLSPDGTQAAIVVERDDNYDIYVGAVDGSGTSQITDDPAEDLMPAWSPDGQQIAFVSKRDGDREIFVMQADGSQLRQLTKNDVIDERPSWSPDGKRIVFEHKPSETGNRDYEIWVMDSNGSNAGPLTENDTQDHWPSYSPDGTKIVFRTGVSGQGGEGISIRDAKGQVAELVAGYDDLDVPRWSPDSKSIAFGAKKGDNWDVYLVTANQPQVTQLTDEAAVDIRPIWSPDGQYLAFSSDRDGDFEVYVVGIDGSGLVQLTKTEKQGLSDISDVAEDWH